MFVIRWTGWIPDPPESGKRYVASGNVKNGTLVTRSEARRFKTRDEAVKYCKVRFRNGRFATDWKDCCHIEEVGK